ncbi:T9SS type A sorting domain-containing protein [Nonlabens arenilitoris]|nr:T9SS type A sorting domain-containing protein [Nonlabens arenilitoris]
MKKILLTLLICTVTFNLNAQVSDQTTPPSWAFNLKSQPVAEIMPSFDLQSMIAEDAIEANQVIKKPYRFGKKFSVAMDLFNSGQWTELENGDRLWRLNVVSSGARTMNFMMDRYNLPEGAEMYIYNDEHTDKIGPYTINENQDDGILGTWVVYGDNVWIEYYEPASVRGLGRISINEVVHGYRGFGEAEESFLKLNESAACNVDVMCNPNQGSTNGQDWSTIRDNYRHAVARIIINGAGLCTGTLVNNVREDGTPYFLTADHCLGNTGDGAGTSYSATGWSFGFDWYTNTPDCATNSNTVGAQNPTRVIAGATLRANRGASDVALFELNTTPPASWDLYYAGWSRATSGVTSQLSIHHPSGDIMKLARNDQSASFVTVSGISCWNIADWDYGVTEGGSSGSCLLNPQGQIIGQLLGGSAACSGTNDNGAPDFYGRFNVSWNTGGTAATQLKDWLDPDNTGAASYDGDYYSTLSTTENQVLNFSVFPNPSKDIFNFDLDQEASYQVYDLSGKVIATGEFTDNNNSVDLSAVSNGIYFINVQTINGKATAKLIKE